MQLYRGIETGMTFDSLEVNIDGFWRLITTKQRPLSYIEQMVAAWHIDYFILYAALAKCSSAPGNRGAKRMLTSEVMVQQAGLAEGWTAA